MEVNSLFIKAVVLGSTLLLSTTALASNPFKRPEVQVVERTTKEASQERIVTNPYADNALLEDYLIKEIQPKINPLLNKESVVFRGSINGIDLYFDKATGQYIHDNKKLETINLLSSSLPELEKVNY